jgi:hypothetical protein
MRLAQHERTILKRHLGVETAEEATARIAALTEMERQAETARQASLTETQRERERAERAEAANRTATARSDAHERRSALLSAAAARGIKQVDYADFLLRGEAKDADFGKLLDGLLATPENRATLGAAPVPTVPVPVPPTNPGAPAPAPAPTPPASKNCLEMTAQEWSDYQAQQGIR